MHISCINPQKIVAHHLLDPSNGHSPTFLLKATSKIASASAFRGGAHQDPSSPSHQKLWLLLWFIHVYIILYGDKQ
jgi:hypothetical protein